MALTIFGLWTRWPAGAQDLESGAQRAVGEDAAGQTGADAERNDDDRFELFPEEEADDSDLELREEGIDPCALNEGGNWIDWLNRTVTRSVCGSSRWFDGFFGTQQEFEQRNSTFGRLGLGAFWDEDDGIDPEFRFRAKVSLPNLNHRWQAAIGRGSVDEVLEGEDTTSPAEEFFDEENEWLVGFGYNLEFGRRARLTPVVGARLSEGFDPYVRLRYLFQAPVGERLQFRLRVTPQWQESVGFGYTFRPSVDRMLGDNFMLRWDISLKDFEERFEGFSYRMHVNLFQRVNHRNALRYRVGVASQSRLAHQPQDAGMAVQWRRTVYKEILIVESTVGTTFRRRPGEPEREPELILGLVFEIKFGR